MPLHRACVLPGVTVLAVLVLGLTGGPAQAVEEPDLATAASFAVLAASTVTNTGPSVVSGDLGVSPGTAVTGFGPGTVVAGTIHRADAVALAAQNDLTTAYNTAAGLPPTAQVTADLGGQRLVPGVYAGPTLSLTGALTLDAGGDPNARFVFQAGSTLITASSSSVLLLGGTNPCNVFWQVGSSANLGTNSSFVGSVLALTSVTATTGATVSGRLLARNAAVTLDANTITRPLCTAATPTATPTPTPTDTPTPTPTDTPTPTPTDTPTATATPTATIPAAPTPTIPPAPAPAPTIPPAPTPTIPPAPAPTPTIPPAPAPGVPAPSAPAPGVPAPGASAPIPPLVPVVLPPSVGPGILVPVGPPATPGGPTTGALVPTLIPVAAPAPITGSVASIDLALGSVPVPLSTPSGQLPRTGAPIADLARCALLLMGLGLLALASARHRRSSTGLSAGSSRL